MDQNDMMHNFMAAMGAMSTMMNQFQQPAPAPPPIPTGPPPSLGAGYGYGGGASHAPPVPPPPPPQVEDIPLPPSYNYPRFLEPEMERSRNIVDSSAAQWNRKTDEEIEKEKKLSSTQKSLIEAAERAAKINKKLTGMNQKPLYDELNVPQISSMAQNRPLTKLALNYIPTDFDQTTGITNVPFVAQKGSIRFKSL